MTRINPAQVQYIKDMQPDFDFQERKIQPSLDVASSDDLFRMEGSTAEDESQESAGGTKASRASRASHLSRSLSSGSKPQPLSLLGKARPPILHQTEETPAAGTGAGSGTDPRQSHHRVSKVPVMTATATANAPSSRLTIAVPPHAPSHGTSGTGTPGGGPGAGLSNEDRRLLTRAKWLLKRLLDPDEDSLMNPLYMSHGLMGSHGSSHPSSHDPHAAAAMGAGEGETTDDEDAADTSGLDGETRWKIEHYRKKMAKKFHFVECRLREILNDEVKKRETLFVLNILSFLKDGNSKCLSEEDSRSWAQELLQSVGRSTDLISTIMGNKSTAPGGAGAGAGGGGGGDGTGGRRSSSSSSAIDPEVDMDTWRSVLVHMRAHYPIGMAAKAAHVQFNDESDPLHTKILKRIETMKADLVDIVHLKEDKIQNSKSGKILESTISLNKILSNSRAQDEEEIMTPVGTLGPGGDPGTGRPEKGGSDHQSFNLYAENILNEAGKRRGGAVAPGVILEEDEEEGDGDGEGDEEEDLRKYDEICLTKEDAVPPHRQATTSQLLSLQQSLVDTLSSSGKSIEYDDNFVIDQQKKEEEDRERDRVRLRERRKGAQQQEEGGGS
jgi:hypothetical protein